MTNPTRHALVIGAGFGGMAAALRLRAKGYRVTLVDQCTQLGGRAHVYAVDGYRHDAGPTVITAPFLIEELFGLFGERMADHLEMIPLTPWYRFVYSDGETFDYGGSQAATLAEIARLAPQDVAGYGRLLAQSKKIFDVGFLQLADRPFDRFLTMLKQVPALLRLQCYKTVWGFVSSHVTSEKLRQAFSIQPLLVGGNPFDTTSIYSLIHFLENAYGVHFAKGGTGRIVSELGALMERQGIDIRLQTAVKEIAVDGRTATGVILADGHVLSADLVVTNADAAYLYKSMVPKPSQTLTVKTKLKFAHYSMGLFVLYFGTTRAYPDVVHHTIVMGHRFKELLRDIFDRKILSDDVSLYLHRPTATDPSFAPAGCDAFYVLCPVPNLQGQLDWTIEGPRLRDRLVAVLSKTVLPGLEDTITADFFKTPQDFETDYASLHGAGFSIAPLFRQSAWFRFHNKAEGLRNLFLVGAGTHPGAGLPGVLCSAKVVDALVPCPPQQAVHGMKPHQSDLTVDVNVDVGMVP